MIKPFKIPVSYWRYIPPLEIFWVDQNQWHRFSKKDQKFLKSHSSFYLKELGYPLVHTKNGTYFVEESK